MPRRMVCTGGGVGVGRTRVGVCVHRARGARLRAKNPCTACTLLSTLTYTNRESPRLDCAIDYREDCKSHRVTRFFCERVPTQKSKGINNGHSCTSKEEAPAEGRPNMKTRRKPVLAPIGVVARRQLRPPVCAPFFQDSAPPPSPWPRRRYIVIAEKTGLCLQMDGPS